MAPGILTTIASSFEPDVAAKSNETTKMDKQNTKSLSAPLTEDDRAVLSLRCLMYDICNQHGGGHGGSAIGMAAIGVALWKYTMRYNPLNSEWFDRDRFVLSNGRFYQFEI